MCVFVGVGVYRVCVCVNAELGLTSLTCSNPAHSKGIYGRVTSVLEAAQRYQTKDGTHALSPPYDNVNSL